jgi:hypothetical protein
MVATETSQRVRRDWTVLPPRRAALVAGVAGLALPVSLLATLLSLGSYRENFTPGVGDSDLMFTRFYEDNFGKIRLTETLAVWSSVLVFVFVVSLIHVLDRRSDLVRSVVIGLAAAATAVETTGHALLVSPTLVFEMTADNIGANLDPGVARALIMIPDTLSAVAGILFGFAFIGLGLMILGSDLTGRMYLGVTALLIGTFGPVNLLLGGGGGLLTVTLWIVPAAVLVLIYRKRLVSAGSGLDPLDAAGAS